MRLRQLAIAIAAAATALAAVTTALAGAQRSAAGPADRSRARLEQGDTFTRVQTVTVVSAQNPLATALTTIWENYWQNISFQFFEIPLPSDFATLTVGSSYKLFTNIPPFVSLGEVFTNKIKITPTLGLTTYLRYYTNNRAIREGNQFRIFIRASSPRTSAYKTSVLFNSSFYQFVSYSDDTPTDTLPIGPPTLAAGRATWGPITVTGSDTFYKSLVLADKRLIVDLIIESPNVIISPDKRSAQVTAVVKNNGSVPTGDKFILELYDRPDKNPNDPPDGPNDHAGGACRDSQCSTFRFSNVKIDNNPYNPALALQPGQSRSFTFNYTFETGGFRDLYLQVDTFGGNVGFNLETGGEGNNIIFLGTYQAVGRTYLPVTLKNRP